ncbi:MAG: family 20 glycosylhydrolase [Aliidongia sp.]
MHETAKYPRGTDLAIGFTLLGNDRAALTFRAELTITNRGPVPLPAQGWAIYFNFCRMIHADSVGGHAAIGHVNGDLMRLAPAAEFGALRPGQSCRIGFAGALWLLQETDAPDGFFIVYADGTPGAFAEGIGDAQIAPFAPADQLMRGEQDLVPAETPVLRFERNAPLTLLPAEAVGRITPTPRAADYPGGNFTLGPDATVAGGAELSSEALYLRNALAKLMTGKLALTAGDAAAIMLRLDAGLDEAYRLTVGAEGITITGGSPAAVFHAIQSLLQLLPVEAWRRPQHSLAVPCCTVEDAPRFGYRGLHFDVARNFSDKATVLRVLDLMALYKLNTLHFHLTDDEGWRLEIPSLPELTGLGSRRGFTQDETDCLIPSFGSGADQRGHQGSGFYSRADFIEILHYARARHIEIIPEIDLPGHARAAILAMRSRWRRLMAEGRPDEAEAYRLDDPDDRSAYESVQHWHDNVVCIGAEPIYRFFDAVVRDIKAMYDAADTPLRTIHTGGDEVPHGAWDGSPLCRATMQREGLADAHALLGWFFERLRRILAGSGLAMAGWEEIALRHKDGRSEPETRLLDGDVRTYVWNNVWGWGQEDIAYRLANLGYKVVLCNVTNLYLDLAYEKDPPEPGYYWGGYIDTRKAYEFCPLDIYTTASTTVLGQALDPAKLAGMARLTQAGAANILGMQALLWAENVRNRGRAEYLLMPRLIAMAERCWAADPGWTQIADRAERQAAMDRDWNGFANRLGQRELPRLDGVLGGIFYRVPVPGVVIRDGLAHANCEAPGLTLRYTLDGSEPWPHSLAYAGPVHLPHGAVFRIAAFTTNGRRSRTAGAAP